MLFHNRWNNLTLWETDQIKIFLMGIRSGISVLIYVEIVITCILLRLNDLDNRYMWANTIKNLIDFSVCKYFYPTEIVSKNKSFDFKIEKSVILNTMNAEDLICSVCLGPIQKLHWDFHHQLEYRFGILQNHFKDIFVPPIRLTDICGHNFCHQCLLGCIGDRDNWNCPDCRSLQTKKPDELMRNRLVEKAVTTFNEKLARNQANNLCSKHSLELTHCKFPHNLWAIRFYNLFKNLNS